MRNIVELFINNPVNAKLDIGEYDIALQYSIADIRDISKRNAAYSKTIVLPGTKNNNYYFGNLFDVNSDFTMFNPNIKTECKLLVNSEVVIDGFLQLRKINKVMTADFQGNEIQYEIVVFNNAVDLMTELGEKTIDQLDLREWGHTYSISAITQSWDNTYEDAYVYPMYGTETSPTTYSANWFWPSMFYWTLLDRTLYEAGFGWTGSLKTNPDFQKEIVSYVSDGRPKIEEEERRRREFRAGITSSITLTMGTFSGGSGTTLQQTLGPTHTPFNDDFTPNNFDNDNNWSTTTYEWTLDRNGAFSAEFNLSGTFSLYNGSGATVSAVYPPVSFFSPDRNIGYFMQARCVVLRNGQTIPVLWGSVDNISLNYELVDNQVVQPGVTFSPGQTRDVGSFNLSAVLPILQNTPSAQQALSIGDRVWVEVTVKKNSTGTGGEYWNGALQAQLTFDDGTFFKNNAIASELTQGDYIQLGQYLPDKIKQKDLITDLIRRYNLYIEVDPNNDRLLILNPRPDFYNSGTIVDWTSKKDYNSPDNIQILSELQFKKMIWTYKLDDADDLSKAYLATTGDNYGWREYDFDNDFVKGESKMESPFSATPIIWNDNIGAHLPAINPDSPKVAPRVLYWGGLRDCGNNFTINYQNITTGLPGSTTLTRYPYSGHFDDPVLPNIDINFGTNKYYFYSNWEYITNNNMFNKYWANYIKQIEDGRLVTSKFNLNEYDIRFIKDNFNTKIFILDSYYYVNKILDYKPMEPQVTTVELIKIVDGIAWEGQYLNSQPGLTAVGPVGPNFGPLGPNLEPAGPVKPIRPIREWGFGNLVGGGGIVWGNNNNGGGSTTATSSNGGVSVKQNRQMTFGDNNSIAGDMSFVLMGDTNIISNRNSSIINGSGNSIEADNVILIGVNGLTASDSDRVYLGPSFSVSTIDGTMFQNGSTFSLSGTAGYIPKFIGTNTLANSGWIDFNDITAYITSAGTYSVIHYYNQSLFPKGSLSSPGIAFIDDNENGLYYSASNVYMVATTKFNVMINGATTSTFDNKALDMWNKPIQRHRWSVTTITGTSSLTTETTNYVIADGGGTMYLPTAADGRPLTIKNSGASLVYVQATASQTIDGSTASLPLSQWESVDLIGDGNNWFIV
jgi:hypothetical protein